AQIDDAQPAVTERHAFSDVGAVIVRATVHQTRLHALDEMLVAPVESADAAHEAPLYPVVNIRSLPPHRRGSFLRRTRRQDGIEYVKHPPCRLRPAKTTCALETECTHFTPQRLRARDLEQRLSE